MPVFSYSAVGGAGQSVNGEVAAEHERAALRELKRRGLTPLSLAIAAQPKQRSLGWRKRANLEDHIRLVNELAVLIEAGVSLNEAIDIASRSSAYQMFGDALSNAGRDLRRGASVPAAFRSNIATFPLYVYQLVDAGNHTGNLINAFKDASQQMQFDDRIRKDVRSALIYPMFLITMGIASTFFIFLFVVPRFAAMLKDRIASLPPFSRGIFFIGMFLRDNLPWVLVIVVLLVIGAIALLRRPVVWSRLPELAVRLPIVGKFFVESEAGRWTAMLATLLQNRVPLVQSLALAREALHIESLKARLAQVERAVRGGNALGAALEDYAIFDETLINLVRVGERSGRLADMLRSAAGLSEQRGRDRIRRAMAVLEPAAIVVIGGLIGIIVVSLFTAIASINNVSL